MRSVMAAVGLAVIIPTLSGCATAGASTVHGRVIDVTGPLTGVNVTVDNNNGFHRRTVSRSDGTYAIGRLLPGEYIVSAQPNSVLASATTVTVGATDSR